MKKLALGLALALGISTGISTADAGTLELRVQRELRKNDAWVEDLIQTDYVTNIPSKRIKFKRCSAETGRIGFYKSFFNEIIIPDTSSKPEFEQSIDALDHELTHALYDIFYGLEKNNNLKKSIDDYCKRKIEEPPIKAVYGKTIEKYKKKHADFKKIVLEYYVSTIVELSDKISNFNKLIRNNSVGINLNELTKVLTGINEYANELSQYVSYVKDIKENTLDRQKIKKMQGFEELEIRTHELFNILNEMYEDKNLNFDYAVSQVNSLKLKLSESKGIESAVDLFTKSFNNFGKPGYYEENTEIFARVIDSLYNLNFTKVSSNEFTLHEGDLRFLEDLNYKGKKLFWKGVQKYRLGLEMIRDGMNPAYVKEKLEYATSFVYKDNVYFWPDSNITITGDIPRLSKDTERIYGIKD